MVFGASGYSEGVGTLTSPLVLSSFPFSFSVLMIGIFFEFFLAFNASLFLFSDQPPL